MSTDESAPTGGSGRGGAMGAPSFDADLAPSDADQEGNAVVSGGGLVGPEDDEEPSTKAKQSPSAQDPD
jgi:hypothetical protein